MIRKTALLLISHVYKTLCFSFEELRAVKLIQQIAANLNSGYVKGVYFLLIHPVHTIDLKTDNLDRVSWDPIHGTTYGPK